MNKLTALGLTAVLALTMTGCTKDNVAQQTVNIIQGVINVAKVEIGTLPAADQAPATTALGLLQAGNTQLAACNASVGTVSLSRSQKFLACFNDFAAGLNSPAEQAALKSLSATGAASFDKYFAAVVVGVNAAVTYFGGNAVTVTNASASSDDLKQVAQEIGHPELQRYIK